MPDIDFQKIELNLIPKKGDEPVIFYASQYETARPFIADLMWGETEFAPGDDCYAEIDIRKNDDNLVVITEDVSIDNNEVSVILPVQAVTCIGKNLGQVKIYSADEHLIAALNFILEVQADPLAGGVTSETAIDNLTQQIEDIAEEVIGEDYYDKTEVDALLADKADVSDLPDMTDYYTKSLVYNKTEADTLLSGKLNDYQLDDTIVIGSVSAAQVVNSWDSEHGYYKQIKNAALNTYSKSEIDTIIDNLLPTITASGAVASVNVDMVSNVTYIADENATKIMKTSGSSTLSGFIKNIYNGTYAFIDLGSLEFLSATSGAVNYFYIMNSYLPALGLKQETYPTSLNIACYPYTAKNNNNSIGSALNTDMTFCRNVSNVCFRNDSISTNEDFKTAMTGIYLIYELETAATPSITDTDFDNICTSFNINGTIYAPADTINTSIGENNFFGDVGDISLSCKDTIQHYIDTRL